MNNIRQTSSLVYQSYIHEKRIALITTENYVLHMQVFISTINVLLQYLRSLQKEIVKKRFKNLVNMIE